MRCKIKNCQNPLIDKTFCQRHRDAYNQRVRKDKKKYHLREFGLSLVEYNQLVEKQMNRCVICGWQWTEGHKKLAVDHNHVTGKIRGLLCANCNAGLGQFKDNPWLLQKAAEYIQGNS
jgi:hypothetical protein